MKCNLGTSGREWCDDVQRQSPRVEVEHDVREQPEVERAYTLARVGMPRRQIERGFTRLCDSKLKIPVAVSLGTISGIVELLRQSRVHIRDVELLQIIVAVERPVGIDQV